MQENEFEKQVRQKMDGFSLRPSAPVWAQVDAELRKKRRRKLILFPILAAALLAGGFFIVQELIPGKENSVAADKTAAVTKPVQTNEKPATTNDTRTDEVKDIEKSGSQPQEKIPVKEDDKEIIAGEKSVAGSNKIIKNKKFVDNSGRKKIEHSALNNDAETAIGKTANGKKIDGVPVDNFSVKVAKNRKKDLPNNNTELTTQVDQQTETSHNEIEEMPVAFNIISVDHEPVSLDYAPQQKMPVGQLVDNKLPDVQLPVFKPLPLHSSRGLKLGVVFAAGVSSRADKPLQVKSSEEKSASASLSLAGIPVGNGGTGGVLVSPPSDIKPGAAFKAGVIAVKPVSKRFEIAAGLLYAYSSDRIEVSQTPASSVNNSYNSYLSIRYGATYAAIPKTDYTNKYHFIELPVSAYYTVTSKWKTPLIWNAGVSFSRLMSSNILLYDAVLGGVYYDGNKDVNKTQVNISTGFSFRFARHNGWQWNIGPEVYMSATTLFDNTYDKNKHAVYGGLHVQALFPVKKKK